MKGAQAAREYLSVSAKCRLPLPEICGGTWMKPHGCAFNDRFKEGTDG
ncbi:MAG: hypothetical protein M2R45_03866 [Verrucomicrobia subdivision 3 bacterium]|nr:hypothetical protein [Limisphaerales bacterium]MCS1412570.1 hypothetical protein [Limisphaerales bacterium]